MRRARTILLGAALSVAASSACVSSDPSDSRARVEDYLLEEPYARVVIELDVVDSASLPADVAGPLVEALEELIGKPVEIVYDEDLAPDDDPSWSPDAFQAFARERFNLEVAEDAVKIHLLLLDGRYYNSEGDELLGVAWEHRHVGLFLRGVKDACGSLGGAGGSLKSRPCQSAQLSVLAHEFGHVLGLVNNGVPMATPHEDPEHPGHSDDPECVMYWAYERSAVVKKVAEAIEEGVDPSEALRFCAASRDDIAAFQARE